MKKTTKVIIIILLIVILFLGGLFAVRAKQSKELKSGLLREDSNGIIQQVVWGGNDLSINVNGPRTALRIPISSVVPETLTRKNFKFKLNLYDENGNKLDYIINGIERGEGGGVTSGIVIPIFKDSILGMKEFKMPVGAISRINEDTFQVELEDFDGYADMAGDNIRYKIFGKGKIDSVYLEIFHGNNVKLEFAIIDDEVIIEDYCEGAECKDSYPWEIEDLYGTYKLVGFNYEITDIPATLTISEKLIGAKFCNDMGSDNYSIGDNYIHVNNMSQTEMLCESEKLMEYESKFDLSNAKISLVERNLRLTTPNGDIYDFFKNDEESIIEPEILDHLDSKILIDIESLQTPKFEEIDEIVAICPFDLLGGGYIEGYDEYNQTRRSFLLPYKDGFIGYELRGQEGAQFVLTYRLKSDPCNRISYSDEIFWRNQYYNPVERRSGLEYPDDKIYISQGLWSGIPTDTIVKNLDCVSGENQKGYGGNANCRKKAEQYFYNLFIGIEQNEYFTKRMDDFKKNIDNGVFTTSGFRVGRNNTCSEKVRSGIGEVQPTDSEEIRQNYIKLKNEKMHECAMEYFK